MTRVVLVPGALALLPEYAGLADPVAELRAACLVAVSWLGPEVEVVADEQGARVAAHLLAAAGPRVATAGDGDDDGDGDRASYLVVGNGSATRTEKAPGHLDERAHAFDARLGEALRTGDPDGLGRVDQALARELWAGVGSLARLGSLLDGTPAVVDYDDDPYGVQYWVMRWSCAS